MKVKYKDILMSRSLQPGDATTTTAQNPDTEKTGPSTGLSLPSSGQATTPATTCGGGSSHSNTQAPSTSTASHKQVSANETILFFWYDTQRGCSNKDVLILPRHLQAGLASCCLKTNMRPVLLRYQRFSNLPKTVFQQDCSQYLPFEMFKLLLQQKESYQQIRFNVCVTRFDLCLKMTPL